jgi:polysaccharide export outer membrane protein
MSKIYSKFLSVLSFGCAILLATVLFTSCVNTKRAAYFYGIGDTTIRSPYNKIPEPVIVQNDILTISVSSANPQADAVYNAPNALLTQSGSVVAGSLGAQVTGYLVNSEGFIQFPTLGNIKVVGLTKKEIKTSITNQLIDKKLLIDPVVTIRFINFRVTVMGEVKNPTVISVPSEKMSLLEALGMAGDLTVYGKRENILLIREENGEKIIKRINLNSTDLLYSPYYYLQSNDIIYVEANAAKLSSAERSMQILPIALSGLSVLAVIVGLILK